MMEKRFFCDGCGGADGEMRRALGYSFSDDSEFDASKAEERLREKSWSIPKGPSTRRVHLCYRCTVLVDNILRRLGVPVNDYHEEGRSTKAPKTATS